MTKTEQAFVEAARILKRLEDLGHNVPSIELFADASCRLKLNKTMRDGSSMNRGAQIVAEELLYSDRWEEKANHLLLSSCYGLFTAVGKKEE